MLPLTRAHDLGLWNPFIGAQHRRRYRRVKLVRGVRRTLH